jgi:hypothetical protein
VIECYLPYSLLDPDLEMGGREHEERRDVTRPWLPNDGVDVSARRISVSWQRVPAAISVLACVLWMTH